MPASTPPTKWPKVLPPLTPEQKHISDDFMKLWHEVLPRRFGIVETFNHNFPVKYSQPGFKTTLEIGAGLGEHLHYERLTAEQEQNYYALELRENMAAEIRKSFPRVQAIVGDCQTRLDFADGYFDRVVAVHVLEHLPNLPAAIREAHRLVNKETGYFLVVIPTEGSPAYTLARKMSAERVYKKRYGGDYSWFYQREHINLAPEIFEELAPWFAIEARSYFPLRVPFIWCNLCIGLALRPKVTPLAG
jgi:SAM-dependent methyltransferase